MKKNSIAKTTKNVLFFITMLAPIIAIAVTCLYVIFNKNAYQSFTTGNTLDNAFYVALANLETQDLFAWTTSTAIYTPINAMFTGLGVTNNAISILTAYWLIIAVGFFVITIVIDLIIWLYELLTAKIGKK